MIGNRQVGCARSGNIVAVARYNSIVRSITAPFVVAPPAATRVQTRLRPSQKDTAVLGMVGEHLGRLAGGDLARRCVLGPGADSRTGRKRALTPASSSRWAGAITRTSNDQWQRGWRNLLDARASLRRAIRVIQGRLEVPVGGRHGRIRGYATRQERWAKQQRLQHLQARLARVERRLRQGRVSVCRGGRRLAKARHQLEDARLSEGQWRQRWTAERLFLTADGQADKALGNETIRVHPEEGWPELKLPVPLAHLANRPHGRYRLSCPVRFTHRADEWAAQVASGAVRYDITYQPDRGRWYLAASWRLPASPTYGTAAGRPWGAVGAASGSTVSWLGSRPANSGTGWCRWPPTAGSRWWRWTPRGRPSGARPPGSGPSKRGIHNDRSPGITPPVWCWGVARSGCGRGGGQVCPHPTGGWKPPGGSRLVR
jgi:hypothetical protein